ncbi:GNAT family N-acetyltransferase [Mycolicibacterium goodii]|uniref:GNAT family N-acetyltransferase n=1 Tax=Mycolicibacterium goodii TaxID=134601 RepID=A0ABS6HHH4_MYCGD|nr:GNAT family N-acetyltransferase [Mycolicibacterium goodii]OKH64128.1 GCN5 family acetyltransferase [Mycobacterium sp. SWH-M5]MBU8812160.1 GNAT family N-acetyltransferase [Mycolicibacterium goodii]MBU8815837.1 GNAT family N-acetyltransferase [Mycolicibacterium goodii]MBU8822132.1 GNAT family N-acetyltransferase [Mycolicibacterium goodii]MBU8831739.1 GNAT family N-acetyltransferase [Mycolicibacterium goodii]
MTGTPVIMDVMRLTPADWRLFSAIRLRALADSLGADDPHYRHECRFTAGQWRRRLCEHAQFAATSDGRVVGLIGAQYQNTETIYLYSLWVDPSARNCGVGRQLISTAVQWARDCRVHTIRLRVAADNTVARSIYEDLGFGVCDTSGATETRELAMALSVR